MTDLPRSAPDPDRLAELRDWRDQLYGRNVVGPQDLISIKMDAVDWLVTEVEQLRATIADLDRVAEMWVLTYSDLRHGTTVVAVYRSAWAVQRHIAEHAEFFQEIHGGVLPLPPANIGPDWIRWGRSGLTARRYEVGGP